MKVRDLPIATILLSLCLIAIHAAQWKMWVDTDKFALDMFYVTFRSIVTYSFLHANPLHLAVSVIFLILFGGSLERRSGFSLTAVLFLLGGMIGGVLWVAGAPSDSPLLVGSSAAVTALVCCMVLTDSSVPVLLAACLYAVSQFFLAQDVHYSTTHYTLHAGGAISGMIGWFFVSRLGLERKSDVKWSVRKDKDGQTIGISASDQPEIDFNEESTAKPAPERAPRRTTTSTIPVAEPPETTEKKKTVPMHLDSVAMDEVSLTDHITANPDDIEAFVQLVEIYLTKKKVEKGIKVAVPTIRLLAEARRFDEAWDLYRRVSDKLGPPVVAVNIQIALIRNRLQARDRAAAEMLLEQLKKDDPNHAILPDLTAAFCSMIVEQLGADSEKAKIWFRNIKEDFPAHPSTLELFRTTKVDFNGDSSEKKTIELEQLAPSDIEGVIASGQTLALAEKFLENRDEIASENPVSLASLAKQLIKEDRTIKKGIMLLELTVRTHVNHKHTPALILELIHVYTGKLQKAERAAQWKNFLIERWPDHPAAKRAQAL